MLLAIHKTQDVESQEFALLKVKPVNIQFYYIGRQMLSKQSN